MLVKRTIVERWYQRDSWVFKQFSYLFQNPIWHKKVPNGFSVCPYFWLSLFSFFIFRPLVVAPIHYLFRPLVLWLGKPARSVDKAVLRFMNWVSPIADMDNMTPGLGLLFAVIVLLLTGLTGWCGWKVWVETVTTYASFQEGHNILGMFAIWTSYSFAGLFAVIGGHKLITKTDCKTMNYLWVWFGLFLIASLVFIPTEIGHGIATFFGGIWGIIAVCGIGIWKGISFLLWGAGAGGGWLWKATYHAFTYAPVKMFILPWWAYIAVLTMAAYVSDKFMKKLDDWEYQKYMKERDEEMFRGAWLRLFNVALYTDELYKKGKSIELALCGAGGVISSYSSEFRSATQNKALLYETAFRLMWKEKLEVLKQTYPATHKLNWKVLEKETEGSLYSLFEGIEKALGVNLGWNPTDFQRFVTEAYKEPEVQKVITEDVLRWEAEEEAKSARHLAWINGWTHQTCLKVTVVIGDFVKGVCSGIKKISVNVWTFIVYLGMLAKAKKKGACPYFPFSDPEQKP